MKVDIAIVGGGPAGSSLALHLVRQEKVAPARIVMIDKAKFPRDKPCAGAISQFGLEVLAEIGVVPTVPSVSMRGVRVIEGDRVGETESPMGIVIRRTEFDAELLRLAERAGVVVREGDGLKGIARSGRGWTLELGSGERLEAAFVAAADGAGSTTRKLLGLREPERKGHLYVLDTEETDADAGVKRGLVDFDLSVLSDGIAGYYWDFPTPLGGRQQVSRGIYDANLTRDNGANANAKAVLKKALAKRGIDIEKTKLRPFSTRPYVPGSIAAIRGLVFVGEACGIDQTTGEGIAQAIEMGRLASKHLAAALRTRHRDFTAYARDVRTSTTGRHLLQSAWMCKRVYGRVGLPARNFLLHSSYAREQAVRWYRGEELSLKTQLELAGGLARSLFA
jgi:flavin-dependent dehydrogenase